MMMMKYRLRSVAACAALAALCATGAAGMQPQCQHLGAEWRAPKVINIGATQCPKTKFSFTIGTEEAGGQVSVTYHGCPAFIDMVPGHGELVQRLHKNPVGPQSLNHTRQRYKADCGGWFRSPSCKPDGDSNDLAQTVNHWDEEACPVVAGGASL